MNEQKLFTLGPPLTYLVSVSPDEFANLYLRLIRNNKDAAIRMLRGRKSQTVRDFFNEISAVLQFPHYFGENGAAFDECITDLDWIEGNAYILMLGEADLFLSAESVEQFAGLMSILTKANLEWLTPNQYIPRHRPPTPFHLLCQCESTDASFAKRLRQSGMQFELL